MTVCYEWDVEEVTAAESESFEAGECIDHYHQTSYEDCLAFMRSPVKSFADLDVEYCICIVRDDDEGRAWAYLENGKLPDNFEDAYQVPVAKVPKRFHEEVAKARGE